VEGERIDLKLSLYGIRCDQCQKQFVSTDRVELEIFAHEHVAHRALLFLCTVTDPPEMRGKSANFSPVFKEPFLNG
jgi:hypothetical protein